MTVPTGLLLEQLIEELPPTSAAKTLRRQVRRAIRDSLGYAITPAGLAALEIAEASAAA